MSRLTCSLAAGVIIACVSALASSCASEPPPRDPGPEDAAAYASAGSLRDAATGATAWAFMPGGTVVAENPSFNARRYETLIRSEIRSILTERGHVLVEDASQANRYVAFALGLESDLADSSLQRIFGITPGLTEQEGLVRGTLVIAITPKQTERVIWRGGVQAFARPDLPQETRDERVRGATRRLLSALPRASTASR